MGSTQTAAFTNPRVHDWTPRRGWDYCFGAATSKSGSPVGVTDAPAEIGLSCEWRLTREAWDRTHAQRSPDA